MSAEWDRILKDNPDTVAMTTDRHGMVSLHTGVPTYYDASGMWRPEAPAKRTDYYLSDSGGTADFNPKSTLMYRPGFDPKAPAVAPEPEPAAEHVHPIVALRKENGSMSQTELAKAIDCSANYISMMESGKRPMTLKIAKAICWHFDKSLDDVAHW